MEPLRVGEGERIHPRVGEVKQLALSLWRCSHPLGLHEEGRKPETHSDFTCCDASPCGCANAIIVCSYR